MVYNTQNYWVFGLCPSSCIPETRKQRFGNWMCFLPQVRKETPTLLVPLERGKVQWLRLAISKGPNRVRCLLPLTWGRKQIPKRCFPVSRIEDDGQSPKIQQFICSVCHRVAWHVDTNVSGNMFPTSWQEIREQGWYQYTRLHDTNTLNTAIRTSWRVASEGVFLGNTIQILKPSGKV
jgi:hypothetical protein